MRSSSSAAFHLLEPKRTQSSGEEWRLPSPLRNRRSEVRILSGAFTCSRLGLDHLVNGVRARKTRKLDLAGILESDVACAIGQLLDDRGSEDLAAPRFVGDAGRDDHVLSVEVRLLADRLSRVEPDAHADRAVWVVTQLVGDRVLNRARTLNGPARARKRDHEAVAL